MKIMLMNGALLIIMDYVMGNKPVILIILNMNAIKRNVNGEMENVKKIFVI